jgi:membrane protein required for colicin V production
MFNWVDYTILVIIGLSVAVSFVRGFVREALSLVIWVAAFWIAFTFSNTLSSLLVNTIHSAGIRWLAAFGGLVIITLILGAMLNYLIGQVVDKTGLGGTDRILGVAFGIVRGMLLVTVLIMMARLVSLAPDAHAANAVATNAVSINTTVNNANTSQDAKKVQPPAWWSDSVLIPYFYPVEVWLHDLLPESIKQRFVITY